MATAKKLPSGSYRCRVYVGKENGKDVYKSFTAPTKKQAEYDATQFLIEKDNNRKKIVNEKTFEISLKEYIELKEAVLSPSTIRGYRSLEKNFKIKYPEFYCMKLCDITQADVQRIISHLSKECSPKTVRNYHGLISSVLSSEMILKTTMPQKEQADIYIPTDKDVKQLIKAIEGTEIEIPVLLGAFCMMRRGEICGLSIEQDIDFENNSIHVRHSLVKGNDMQWHLKAPKNTTSDRFVNMPDFVSDKIQEKGYITHLNPNGVTTMFRRVLKANNIPLFRFHDLRHYSASIRHALNIPDAYIMAEGGWKTDTVLKSVYRHAMKDKKSAMQKKADKHFSKIYDTKYDTNRKRH